MKITFTKKLQLIFCLIQTVITCDAQKPLQPGLQLPDVRIDNIINYQSAFIQTGQLKGKTVILYFWNTWCGSCITSMPKLEAMQKKYPDKLQILMITSEDSSKIQKLYQKREYLKKLNLPIVLNDTTLTNLFPHEGVPQVVWISDKQRVCAITDGLELTEKILAEFLNGNYTNLHNKINIPLNFDGSLLKILPEENNDVLFNSVLTKSVKGLPGVVKVNRLDNNSFRIAAHNVPIIGMYAIAYRKSIRLNPYEYEDRVILNVRDNSRFIIPGNTEDFLNVCYCYELTIAGNGDRSIEADALRLMQQDLDRYFKVKTIVEKRKIPCYVLRDQISKSRTSTDTAYIKNYQDEIEFNNQSPVKILSYLTISGGFKQPVLYEGSAETRISIKIRQSKMSFEEIESLLDKCGLSISRESREMNVLVITDL